MQTFMMNALLVISCFCLVPPFTALGAGGLGAYWILSVVLGLGQQGNEKMAEAIQEGDERAGTAWLIIVFIVVIIGGAAALGTVLEAARLGRGL